MKAIWAESRDGIFSPIFWDVPEDLRHFKEKTLGGSVVMGRGTWHSIGSKPLKGRDNYVIVNDPRDSVINGEAGSILSGRGVVNFIGGLDAAPSDSWVIGGAALIDEAFDAGLIDEFYITEVNVYGRDSDVGNAPSAENINEFEIESSVWGTSVTGVAYNIVHYVR